MLKDYGWSPALQDAFAPHAAQGLTPGRVTVQQRDLWTLATPRGELRARLSGRLAHLAGEGELPAAGDFVALRPPQTGDLAVITAVLPRRTLFTRRAAFTRSGVQIVAANIDLALLTLSLNADFSLRRLERYLAAARQSGADPVVVLTKADLSPSAGADAAEARMVSGEAEIIAVSAVTGQGLDRLRDRLAPGLTGALLGSSGVGKSTLINALAGVDQMRTAGIREDDAKGRHTTTHRELVRLPWGGLLLDSPGMRELGLIDADAGVAGAFSDIETLAAGCRFGDCRHESEPGCAVRSALETGDLEEGRWRSWLKLRKELAFHDRQEDRLAREADRRKWATISRANRQRRKSGRETD